MAEPQKKAVKGIPKVNTDTQPHKQKPLSESQLKIWMKEFSGT